MTDEQIEVRVERMMDELDRTYLTTAMTRDHYDLRVKQIDQWAWMQRWSLRLEVARS